MQSALQSLTLEELQAYRSEAVAALAKLHAGQRRVSVAFADQRVQYQEGDADKLEGWINTLAGGVVRTQQDNIIGSVLRLSAKPDTHLLGWDADRARVWSRRTEAQFRTWSETDECDAGCSLNLLGLSLQMLGGALVNGDALVVPLWRPRPGSNWSTRLQVIEADRLATPPHLAHRTDVRGGVEIDRDGAPLAYWIRKTHPGDTYDWYRPGTPDDFSRIPAFTRWGRRRVIHLHDRERWTFAGRGWVDPQKEANAAVTRIQNGISTLEDECAEQGKDWEDVLEQRAWEKRRLDELDLSLEAVFGPDGHTQRVTA